VPLEVIGRARAADALAFLAERPYDNVYVSWLIATGQAERQGEVVAWRDGDGRITGVCYLGAQIVPCGDAVAVDAFARHARGVRPRMIVGPRAAVERFWPQVRERLPAPSAVRERQFVYALDRPQLRGSRADADVTRATRDELDDIVPQSAQMIAGEVGGDPRRAGADFRGRTARIIDARWWWRLRVGGRLAFMCNVGSATPQTAQLQGVWSPPDMRGRGHATRALAAICDHLLDDYPSLCLYVNDFNAAAIALYERVGFAVVGEFQTILFS
jgi:RimJ/RimL family protein N-acetyltransferase